MNSRDSSGFGPSPIRGLLHWLFVRQIMIRNGWDPLRALDLDLSEHEPCEEAPSARTLKFGDRIRHADGSRAWVAEVRVITDERVRIRVIEFPSPGMEAYPDLWISNHAVVEFCRHLDGARIAIGGGT